MIERSFAPETSAPALPASLSIPHRVALGEFAIPSDGLFVVERSADFLSWVEVHRFAVPLIRHVSETHVELSYDFDVQWIDPMTRLVFFRVRKIPPNP
jgi:hypothetical protein